MTIESKELHGAKSNHLQGVHDQEVSGDVMIPGDIEEIGRNAFFGCTDLTSVVIPESVRKIDDGAFADCTGLTEVTIPEGLEIIGNDAFRGCTSLTKVTIPESVRVIGQRAFGECTGLTEVAIPAGLEVIADYEIYRDGDRALVRPVGAVFQGCTSLTEVILLANTREIGQTTFRDGLTKVTVSEGIEIIDADAFAGCTGLAETTVPKSVRHIVRQTFDGCTGLTEVTIPSGVKIIGHAAFKDCRKSTEVTIPAGIDGIGSGAFHGCEGLRKVTISESVREIDHRVFQNCPGLTEIQVEAENQFYSAVDGLLLNRDGSVLLCCPRGKTGRVTIPESVREIGWYAFWNCTGLTEMTIPKNIREISQEVYFLTTGLTEIQVEAGNQFYSAVDGLLLNRDGSVLLCCPRGKTGRVTIPENVKEIGGFAFANCTGLTKVTIPESVKEIGRRAFGVCKSLTRLRFRRDSEKEAKIYSGAAKAKNSIYSRYQPCHRSGLAMNGQPVRKQQDSCSHNRLSALQFSIVCATIFR